MSQIQTPLEGIRASVTVAENAVQTLERNRAAVESHRVSLAPNFGGESADIFNKALLELESLISEVKGKSVTLHSQLQDTLTEYVRTHGRIGDAAQTAMSNMNSGLQL
ncbi:MULTISPECIES: hypothetical protein [Amycolatopsis]|uniref:WXG100 family type VII secretion target n=1 Tax=Amycolatopsis albidoflavus TaxID=102226 RepID=A0ABW5I7U1_9PSEU